MITHDLRVAIYDYLDQLQYIIINCYRRNETGKAWLAVYNPLHYVALRFLPNLHHLLSDRASI